LAAAEQLAALRKQYLAALEAEATRCQGRDACMCWLEADTLWLLLGDTEQAFQCVQKALQQSPSEFSAHLAVARHLIARGEYALAEQQVRWCLLRRPNDRDLTRMLEKAVKGRITMTTQALGSPGAPPAGRETVDVSASGLTNTQATASEATWK